MINFTKNKIAALKNFNKFLENSFVLFDKDEKKDYSIKVNKKKIIIERTGTVNLVAGTSDYYAQIDIKLKSNLIRYSYSFEYDTGYSSDIFYVGSFDYLFDNKLSIFLVGHYNYYYGGKVPQPFSYKLSLNIEKL